MVLQGVPYRQSGGMSLADARDLKAKRGESGGENWLVIFRRLFNSSGLDFDAIVHIWTGDNLHTREEFIGCNAKYRSIGILFRADNPRI